MSAIIASMFALLIICCIGANTTERAALRRFPDDFHFGSATAAYQVEGAWNEDGKSESIWDHMTHTNPSLISDRTNGDVATDAYHQYKRDVEMMRELGLDFHRFSISWTRILPSGFDNKVNYAGVHYYNNLIDEMLKYDIQPMVTLYHWDLPQVLQEMGGLTNPYFVDWFADYARVAFTLFGDRVKMWLTINEPLQICVFGYGSAMGFAPISNNAGVADYFCGRNVILAHARVWHMYNDEFRATQNGEVGYTVNAEWYEPMSDSQDDVDATKRMKLFEWGQYYNPVFSSTGDFPEEMKQRVAAKSLEQGYTRSRLPEFSNEEIEYVRGTSDFLGLNTYSTKLVYSNKSSTKHNNPSFYNDVSAVKVPLPGYSTGAMIWGQVVPSGFFALLKYIKDTYNNPKVYITENGYGSFGGLEDDNRVHLYRSYLDALLNALDYGCNVKKYTAWSLMDNFEWTSGYTARFGLYEVDFKDPKKKRSARKSALVFKEIIRSRVVDFGYEPASLNITIDEGR